MRGETLSATRQSKRRGISIHSPRAGRDVNRPYERILTMPDFNPLAPCGARRQAARRFYRPPHISIHSPRAGRDRCRPAARRPQCYFNPLAPCGARRNDVIGPAQVLKFQSTRPVRGETSGAVRFARTVQDFNPLAPCGARRLLHTSASRLHIISIHSPRAGRDERWD